MIEEISGAALEELGIIWVGNRRSMICWASTIVYRCTNNCVEFTVLSIQIVINKSDSVG